MAAKCPNVNSAEFKALEAELGNSRIRAFQAWKKNGEEMPDINSDLVQKMKKENLNFGTPVEIELDESGEQTDNYKSITNKLYQRISRFVNKFTKNKIDRDKTPAERKADRLWGSIPHEDKLPTEFGEAQTYDEYVAEIERRTWLAIQKGNLEHLAIELVTQPAKRDEIRKEIDDIIDEIRDKEGSVPFDWEWILDVNKDGRFYNVEQIFRNLDINYFYDFDDPADDILRDEIMSEVTVSNDELGLAGTLDMLVRHADGTYTIIDWKSGKSLNKVYRGMGDALMKYGNQATMEITDSVRNRAKLQIALYAVLMRANNPDIKFRNLKLGWIPNKHDSLEPDIDANIDVTAFLPMIEQFLGDSNLMKELGFPEDIREQLLEKDPGIFDPKNYSTSKFKKQKFEKVEDVTTEKGKERLNSLINRLTILVGGAVNVSDIESDMREEVQDLVNEINNMLMQEGRPIENTQYDDLGLLDFYIGNYSEMDHPMVQNWKEYKDDQELEARRVAKKMHDKFESLAVPVLEEYYKEKNIKKILGNRAINYDELWGWAYVKEKVNDEVAAVRERLLTNSETDPELKAKYEALSPAKKKLLNYVNDTIESYFVGDGAYLQETATIIMGEEISHLELYNKNKAQNDKRTWYKGFFFKLPPSEDDIIMREGGGSWLKGTFNKNTLKRMMFDFGTYFREYEYERWGDEQTMPIKFLGNDYIDSSQAYTKNLETIFKTGISELERKRHLDPVMALGKGIVNKLETEKDAAGQPAYERLAKAFDMKLFTDLQRKMKVKNPRGRTRGVRIPMITPKGVEYHKLSVDAVMRGLMKWTSMTTMWIRPWQGIGNGVHAIMLTHRDGMKGSISQLKLLGISGNGIDYTEADIAKADATYFSDFAYNAIKGDLRKSKMWQLAKELDIFGQEFSWAAMEKTMLSMRNRYMREGTLYMFHSIPEEFVSLTTMTAQLMHMKNEVTGKSLWDSYEVVETQESVEGGGKKKIYELKWNGGVRGVVKKGTGENTWEEELKGITGLEAAKIRKVHERLQGSYRKDEAAYIEAYVVGKWFMHLKKYFPRLVLNAFHKKRLETDLGEWKNLVDKKTGKPIMKDKDGKAIPVYEWQRRVTEGRWVTLAGYVGLLGQKGSYKWDNMSNEQKMNLIEAALTMAILFSMYGTYVYAFGDLDDDDTTKKWFKMYLVDNLSQQYNPVDLLRTMKTIFVPVSLAKLVQFGVTGSQMVVASANYGLGNEDMAFTEKGSLRGWNTFVKGVPGLAQYKDIKNRIEKTKDPDSVINEVFKGVRFK